MTEKQRLIQEYVPGKQVTMAHIIASPTADSYEKLGIADNQADAIGILTITPSEASIIAVDIAAKAGDIEIGFVDRFSGSVIVTGDISSVESALSAVLEGLQRILGFSTTVVTKT